MLISVRVASEKIKYAGSFWSFANSNLNFLNSLNIIKSNSLNFSWLIFLFLETTDFFKDSFTLALYFSLPFQFKTIPEEVNPLSPAVACLNLLSVILPDKFLVNKFSIFLPIFDIFH